MAVTERSFGVTKGGQRVLEFSLVNRNGVTARILSFGGIIRELLTPDREGKLEDIVLGFDTLPPYEATHPYFGALVGRVANRIARGEFELNGKRYTLAKNNGANSLHGGAIGFDKRNWDAVGVEGGEGSGIILRYRSPDGEEGYPGNLSVTVRYTLTDTNELTIEYTAGTDAPTIVNLTSHSYFNLSLSRSRSVLDHRLTLNAKHYTPVGEDLIPRGEIAPVAGTPLDFTTGHTLGERIAQVPGGYDHNFVIDKPKGAMGLAASATDPATGRVLEISTTEPGVQLYTGNFLDGSLTGKGGIRYDKHFGFCLETQKFPDAIHHPTFPSIILTPGERYHQITTHRFLTDLTAEGDMPHRKAVG